MKKFIYTPAYKEKILKLREYLDSDFGVSIRKKIFQKLDKQLQLIRTHTSIGISVREKFGIDCDYMCLFVIKNVVFYQIEEDCIKILNIYDEREDYIRKMFEKQ